MKSFETNIKRLVSETVDTTNHYFARLQALANLLDHIYQPLANQQVNDITVDNQAYNLDDLLVLVFEFVQLINTFTQFQYAAESLNQFLGVHGKRLEQLHQQGRLDHLHPLVEFRMRNEQPD